MSQALSQSKLVRGRPVNIRALLRIRPLIKSELERHEESGVSFEGRKVTVNSTPRPRSYDFDEVFGPNSTQEEFFNIAISPVVSQVLDGYNCTIFAYGYTNSGKTYTMEGNLSTPPADAAGVIPRAISALFSATQGEDVKIQISHLEVYNEELIDLMADDEPGTHIESLRLCQAGSSVNVVGLREITVLSPEEAYQHLLKSSQKRTVAETNSNCMSSRSHCIFTISVSRREITRSGDEIMKVGQMHLVDLAGAENVARSGVTGQRGREAGSINKSLSALGRVINALVEKSRYIPYRDSNLTRILQESLGGTAITTIVATVTPSNAFLEQTLSTLEYATRARSVSNQPTVNTKITDIGQLKHLEVEAAQLHLQLRSYKQTDGVVRMPNDQYELWESERAHLAEMEVFLARRDEEIRALQDQIRSVQDDIESARAESRAIQERTAAVIRDYESEATVSTLMTEYEQKARVAVSERCRALTHLADECERIAANILAHRTHQADGVTRLGQTGEQLAKAVTDVQCALKHANDIIGGLSEPIANIDHKCGEVQAICDGIGNDMEVLRDSVQASITRMRTETNAAAEMLDNASNSGLNLMKNVVSEHMRDACSALDSAREAGAIIGNINDSVSSQLEERSSSLSKWITQARDAAKNAEQSVMQFIDVIQSIVSGTQRLFESAMESVVKSAEESDNQGMRTLEQMRASMLRVIEDEFAARRREWPLSVPGASSVLESYVAQANSLSEEFTHSLQRQRNETNEEIQNTLDGNETLSRTAGEAISSARTVLQPLSSSVARVESSISLSATRIAAMDDGVNDTLTGARESMLGIIGQTMDTLGTVYEKVSSATNTSVETARRRAAQCSRIATSIADQTQSITDSHHDFSSEAQTALGNVDPLDATATLLRPGDKAIFTVLGSNNENQHHDLPREQLDDLCRELDPPPSRQSILDQR